MEKEHLLITEVNDRKSLYYMLTDNVGLNTQCILSNQRRLDVYPEFNLIVTDTQINTLSGEKILDCTSSEVAIKKMQQDYVAIEFYDFGKLLQKFAVFNSRTQKVVFQKMSTKVLYTAKYIVYKDSVSPAYQRWHVYDILENSCITENEYIFEVTDASDYFIVTGFPGNYSIYLPNNLRLLQEKSLNIVISKSCKFAMCATIQGNITVYYNRRKRIFYEVEDFGILSEKHSLFYVQRNGKYFVYTFYSCPMFTDVSAEGFDFVGFSQELDAVLCINKGKSIFLKNQ